MIVPEYESEAKERIGISRQSLRFHTLLRSPYRRVNCRRVRDQA